MKQIWPGVGVINISYNFHIYFIFISYIFHIYFIHIPYVGSGDFHIIFIFPLRYIIYHFSMTLVLQNMYKQIASRQDETLLYGEFGTFGAFSCAGRRMPVSLGRKKPLRECCQSLPMFEA